MKPDHLSPILAAHPAPDATPPFPPDDGERIHDAVLRIAARHPRRIAVQDASGALTYRDLAQASARIARRLIGAGLGPGDRIALPARRGAGHVCNLLAVLRIGAVLVPLDGDYPDEWLRGLVRIACPHAILLPEAHALPAWAGAIPTIVRADGPPGPAERDIPAAALAAGHPDDPAYILFTSGTTGEPKAVATGHRPVVNFLGWQRRTFALSPADRFTNLCGIAHDMMIRDIFAPLSIGALLAIPRQEDIFRPARLLDWCARQRPTVAHLTPMMGRLLTLDPPGGRTLPFRALFFGGDALSGDLVRAVARLAPAARIVNCYGTTETPQVAACHVCDPADDAPVQPIGRGIDGVEVAIVDERGDPVPPGMEGEIAVRSRFLSLGLVRGGVLHRHAERGRYRTGDRGVADATGQIAFLGRADDQVNIRGARIELEQVSRMLRGHPLVRDALVLARGEGEARRLIGFAAGDGLVRADLHGWLAERLPAHMVPQLVLPLAAMPLLPNGKVDRRALLALPEPPVARPTRAPRGLEHRLVRRWGEIMGLPEIDPHSSFDALHGDSLNYVLVLLATEEIVGDLPDEWEALSIAELARRAPVTRSWASRWVKPIDSALLIRAVATALIVGFHLHAFPFAGGATTAMFLVAGYLLGKLRLREAIAGRSAVPLWRFLGRILVPTLLFSLAFYAGKLMLGKPASPSVPLLYADLVDYRDIATVRAEGLIRYLWYLSCYVHMVAGLALAAAAVIAIAGPRLTVKRFVVAAFLIAVPLRFVLPGLVDPAVFAHGLEAGSREGFLPTTHFATLMLGAWLANAEAAREKLAAAIATIGYALGTWWLVGSVTASLIAGFGLVLLLVPRLPLPRILHVPLILLAGSSLLIYLTQFYVARLLVTAGLEMGGLALYLGTLATGIGLWAAWQRIRAGGQRLWLARQARATA